MKFKIFFLLFFIFSCSPHYTKLENRSPYNSNGFALIYNENDFEKKIIKNKLDNSLLQISNKNLRIGTLIKLINPRTNDSVVIKNTKRNDYPDFYKILITQTVSDKLNINKEFPLIEVLEIKKNKSFIAEKAKIFQEEKNVSAKVPVDSVQISNISKSVTTKSKSTNDETFILIGSFYTKEAANLLKKRIIDETPSYDIKKLTIKKISSKKFDVLSGPYKSINLLKNDYIKFKNFGFEELDIFLNE